MWEGKRVSVVFPAYNEEENIAKAVNDFYACPFVDEVIVVDNNSRDRTVEEASTTKAVIVHEGRQGYGSALQRGMREAKGHYIVLAEPDGTFAGKDVVKLLSYSDDFDMVMGTRTTKELTWEGANMGWFLRLGNILVAKSLQLLFDGPSLSDCGCTLRLIRRDALARFQDKLSVTGSHFLPEMVILALLRGLMIIEVPVNYHQRVGTSKITGSLKTTFKVGFRMIWLILGYRVKSLAPGWR